MSMLNGLSSIRFEVQTPFLHIALHQRFKTLLPDRENTGLEIFNFDRIHIHAHNMMSNLG